MLPGRQWKVWLVTGSPHSEADVSGDTQESPTEEPAAVKPRSDVEVSADTQQTPAEKPAAAKQGNGTDAAATDKDDGKPGSGKESVNEKDERAEEEVTEEKDEERGADDRTDDDGEERTAVVVAGPVTMTLVIYGEEGRSAEIPLECDGPTGPGEEQQLEVSRCMCQGGGRRRSGKGSSHKFSRNKRVVNVQVGGGPAATTFRTNKIRKVP